MAKKQRAVVSMIAVRSTRTGEEILVQRRAKTDDDTPYDGFIELPQGKVEAGESILAGATRELVEETGLTLEYIEVGEESPFATPESTSQLYVSHPLILVADRLQNHLGIAIVVRVSGVAKNSTEARDPVWVPVSDLAQLLQAEDVFPLNRPMLTEFLKSCNDQNYATSANAKKSIT